MELFYSVLNELDILSLVLLISIFKTVYAVHCVHGYWWTHHHYYYTGIIEP